MSSLDGDKHSLVNVPPDNPVTVIATNTKKTSEALLTPSKELKDELVVNPPTRWNITPYNQMESIKGMTKTMSIHRRKKWERRPERQRANMEMSHRSPLEKHLYVRCNNVKEDITDSTSSICSSYHQKSTQNMFNVDDHNKASNESKVCEYVDSGNIVIRQKLVDNVQNMSCIATTAHGLRHSVDNSSVTKYNALTSLNEQSNICFETDIIDKKMNEVNEQTLLIKSDSCSYMPQMQPRSNSMLSNLSEKIKVNMLPSYSMILDKLDHDNVMISNSNLVKHDTKDEKHMDKINQQSRFPDLTGEGYISDILDRLCLQRISLPFLPSIPRNRNSVSVKENNIQKYPPKERVISGRRNNIFNSTLYHSEFKDIYRLWSLSTLASIKMSAATKSYLMILVLLFISNMAGACSSRSTPKPRPPTHSAMRPNITFQTYACPKAYAEWYCLNGATCFTVKIADSILYNCECADGYMGQRCEFKDLEGSYLPARERFLMGSGSLSGGGLLGQLGSSIGINSSNIGNAFICVLIVIVLAIIVSAVYTHNRTKSKLTRAKVSSQKPSSLSSLPTQSISALADGLELQNSSWSGPISTRGHSGSAQQRSYSLSPSDMNRSALSRGLWIRGNGNKDKSGRTKPSFLWRSSSESSGRSNKMGSQENPQDLATEELSQKSRHLSTISYSLSKSESTPSTPSRSMEYSPTSTVDIQSSCYPSMQEQFYINGGLSRHVPYSQRGRCGHLPNPENIELKMSNFCKESPNAQTNDYHNPPPPPTSIKSEPAQTTKQQGELNFLYREEAALKSHQTSNVRTLQGHVGYGNGHFSI